MNKKVEDGGLKIKSLENEYEIVLRQYEESYQNYLSYISDKKTNEPTETEYAETEYAELKGRSFWGTSGLAQNTADSATDCQDMCISNDKCTGATYNSDKKYCWMRAGESDITASLEADSALIPKSRELLIQLKNYNTQLLKINEKLSTFYASSQKNTQQQEQDQLQKTALLVEYNSQLQDEKNVLDAQIQQIETMKITKNTQDVVATQGYTQFRFWMLIACILLLISMKMAFAVDNDGNSSSVSIGIPILILLILAASFMLRTPQGFMFFGLIIFAVVAIKLLSV